jgi:folate-dependent phosphoribosylglycinamide formyltransferase PurN
VPCHLVARGLGKEAFDRALTAGLEAAGADLVVLAGFMRVLGEGFVARWRGRCINVHPSLLPKFQGGMDLQA